MLILSRKPGTSIVINGDVEVIILRIADGSVKIGIEAPLKVPVYRGEVWERMHGRKRARLLRRHRGDGVTDPSEDDHGRD